ncbi:MAG: tetratricopeptide repeat protein [Bacteroidota bacterium]
MKLAYTLLLFLFGVIAITSCESSFSKDPFPEVNPSRNFDLEKSLKLVDKAIRNDPENAENYFKKSNLLFRVGRYGNAKENLQKALNVDPLNPSYLLFNAEILLEEGKISSARYEASKLLRSTADNEGALKIMSSTYAADGNDSLALMFLDKALEINPSNPSLYLQKAELHRRLNEYAESGENYKKSISIDANLQAFEGWSSLLIEQSLYDSAASIIGDAVENYPSSLKLKYNFSDLLSQSGRSDSAIAYLKLLTNTYPLELGVYDRISNSYLLKYFYDSANHYAKKALEIDSLHKPALLTQARISNNKDLVYNSLEIYNKILQIDSAYVPAKREKESLLRKIAYLQKLKKEMEEFRQIQEIQPLKIKRN